VDTLVPYRAHNRPGNSGAAHQVSDPIGQAWRAARPLPFPAMLETVLSAFQVFLSVMLIVLVLLHSGKDTGLSGAFGVGTGAGPFGGGSLVERNLNRWTIAFALVFVVNIIVLLKI
jgi:preprotein translocase subunit SecG